MNHFPEHILELYVRSSPEVAGQLAAIEQHCAECFSCREMVREMREFYHAAEATTKLLDAAGAESNALVMEAQIRNRPLPQAYVSQSLPVRMVRFVRRRPATSSFFGAVFLMLGYLSFSEFTRSEKEHPEYIQYNEQNNSVQVFDKKDNKLWERRLNAGVKEIINDNTPSNQKITVFDLNHDGANEVIIIPPVMNDPNLKGKAKLFNTVGDWTGDISIPFREIQFNAKKYNGDFYPFVMGVDRGKRNLFISFSNGRSPTIISRYATDGTLVGTYWHFGHLASIICFDVDQDGKEELVLSGLNDTEDETKRSFAATIILDPEKIIGNTESSATPGFGLPTSSAELRYIRYPIPEMFLNIPDNFVAKNSVYLGEKNLRVLTDVHFGDLLIAMEYFYDSTMSVTDVKFNSQTLYYYSTQYKQGKLKQPINDEYTRSLVRSVLYWEGKEWKNDPSSILASVSKNATKRN